MHKGCNSRPGISSSALALFAGIYSRDELRNAGFNFSSNQYILAVQKANMDEYCLMEYDRHVPEATARISDETRKKVSDVLIEYSDKSSNAVFSSRVGSDFAEQRKNFKDQISGLSGGGPIETTRDFYHKSQISDLCSCVKLEEINLWSDSGPHFKNANCLYPACLELSQIFSSKKFKLNYFMENHGKSEVDDHFGVLSRWFKEIERNRYLPSIEDLVSAFREKAQVPENISDSSLLYHYIICRKGAVRGLRIRAKVSSGFRNYLSFYLGDGGLMACPLSLPDPSKYFNIDFRIKVKRDIRTNKYAPDRSNPVGSDTDIMGSTSRNTQRTRMEMLRGIGVSLSS
ncbi:hypothetical protein BB560_000919 [Smittium megazygosporum]|uniref:Uncharacterized protein n=1 Tax=Smittium megazygosporum TaxID=133381 RepID=A0A2T9ZJ93_9FUNG|nr:hypothetical protein BB560_000919 [Smittium megazygosporum]